MTAFETLVSRSRRGLVHPHSEEPTVGRRLEGWMHGQSWGHPSRRPLPRPPQDEGGECFADTRPNDRPDRYNCSGVARAVPLRMMPQPRSVPTMVSGAAAGWAQPLGQPEMWTMAPPEGARCCRGQKAAPAPPQVHGPGSARKRRTGRRGRRRSAAADHRIGPRSQVARPEQPMHRRAAPERRAAARCGREPAARPAPHRQQKRRQVPRALRLARGRRRGRHRPQWCRRNPDGGRPCRAAFEAAERRGRNSGKSRGSSFVIAALVPAIPFGKARCAAFRDGRDKRGHDP